MAECLLKEPVLAVEGVSVVVEVLAQAVVIATWWKLAGDAEFKKDLTDERRECSHAQNDVSDRMIENTYIFITRLLVNRSDDGWCVRMSPFRLRNFIRLFHIVLQ